MTIACALSVGAAPEPYLAATLESIAPVVDLLAVNDNSGLARSPNVEILEASAFAERGALRIERHPFVDFADMRNKAFAPLAALPEPPDWLLFLDADEVHGEHVRAIAREILPRLAPAIGEVDGYTYHFFGTFRWLTDVARRSMFYRFSRGLQWCNPVHERLVALPGRPLVLPYVYHHYGNVLPPRALASKHQRYYELGNPVPEPPAPDEATPEVYWQKAGAVRPFRGTHPPAARATLAALEREHASEFAAIDAGFRARRTPALRAAATLRALGEGLRVDLRRLETLWTLPAATSSREDAHRFERSGNRDD